MSAGWRNRRRRKRRIGAAGGPENSLKIDLRGRGGVAYFARCTFRSPWVADLRGGVLTSDPWLIGVDEYVKIYVGNLSFRATDDDLRAAFEPYGEVVSARVIKDKETGRSRGFGFVEMPNQEQGNNAIAKVNNTEIGDRAVRVNEAQERPPRR
ncbi:MAG: RNA-binding protein [Opitutae bacterium]|nr:RNA-binding protein [Opitutae bacterium]